MATTAAVIFTAGLAFCVYTIALYPLLLAFLARRGRPVERRPEWKTISVVLPVRNGARWIARKLESILALDYPAGMVEILVVSDGSTDGTDEIVRGFVPRGNIRLFQVPPAGKAAALNVALAHASGEILFLTDVRQTLEPSSLRRLVECFGDPTVGAASGELMIMDGVTREEANTGLYWRYEKWIRKNLSALDSVPGATGCIYAMRRSLASPLPADVLNDDMYLPLAAFFRGYRVILDERARAFDFPTALDAEFRRKVRTLAGVYQILRYYPALLRPSNRIWVHFISHKLARLFLPYALIAMAASAWWLPAGLAAPAVAAQAAFYGLAGVDLAVPEKSLWKRLTAPARTFVVLMAASLCAVSVLFVPGRKLWKETKVSEARG